jgi:nicotinamidase-related amidase
VQRTALDALAAGFSVQVAVDACGDVDAHTAGGVAADHGRGRRHDVGDGVRALGG